MICKHIYNSGFLVVLIFLTILLKSFLNEMMMVVEWCWFIFLSLFYTLICNSCSFSCLACIVTGVTVEFGHESLYYSLFFSDALQLLLICLSNCSFVILLHFDISFYSLFKHLLFFASIFAFCLMLTF